MNVNPSFEFFILIAEHRSGSSFLKTALSIQRDISFYSIAGLEKKFSSFGRTSEYKEHNRKRSEFRHGDNGKLIVKLAYSILLKNKKDKKLFGFKCHPHRILEIPNYFEFLNSKNARVIFLTRSNALLRFISLKTIKQTGFSTSSYKLKKSSSVFKLNPVHIDYHEFIEYKMKIEKHKEEVFSNIRKHNLPHMHITYEQLSENFDQCFDKIFDFLNLDKDTIVNPKNEDGTICNHKKINVYKLEDKIINYEEFKKIAEDNNDIETLNFLKENK
jgi:LPS sulfotransferase NodH